MPSIFFFTLVVNSKASRNIIIFHITDFNFHTDDRDEVDDKEILIELENVDDELDKEGIHIVKICDEAAAREYGIENSPALVYFEHEVRIARNKFAA